MTKFIPTENGGYINASKITEIYIEYKKVIASDGKLEWVIQSGFSSEEKAQEWLDNFVQHELLI